MARRTSRDKAVLHCTAGVVFCQGTAPGFIINYFGRLQSSRVNRFKCPPFSGLGGFLCFGYFIEHTPDHLSQLLLGKGLHEVFSDTRFLSDVGRDRLAVAGAENDRDVGSYLNGLLPN